MAPTSLEGKGITRLINLMRRLRQEGGCPWDREQTLKTLRPFIIEEAYEVVSAIDAGRLEEIKEELGDLLFQVVFACRVLEEEAKGDIDEVAGICVEKMIRRHPHVFADGSASTPSEVLERWEEIKKEEKKGTKAHGILHEVPASMPSLMRAQKISKKAAKAGFDWPNIGGVMKKVEEELKEFRQAIDAEDMESAEEELGDLLFTIVNAGRFLGLSPEEALRKTILKFIDRFHYIEEMVAEMEGKERPGMETMEQLWEEAKRREKKN